MAKGMTEAHYSQTSGCEVSVMPDGLVIYQIEHEKVHYLNPTASIIYELCEGKRSLESIAAYLKEAFSLPVLPLAEVEGCIQQLVAERLIQPC